MKKTLWSMVLGLFVVATFFAIRQRLDEQTNSGQQSAIDIESQPMEAGDSRTGTHSTTEPEPTATTPVVAAEAHVPTTEDNSPSPAPTSVDRRSARFMRERSRDRFDDAEVLQSREGEQDADGRVTRLKLVKTQHKYPLVRVEEIMTLNANGERILHQEAMVADHVIAKVQAGTTKRRLQDALAPLGLTIRKEMYAPHMYVIAVPNPTLDSVPQALQTLRAQTSIVSRVQPDYVAYPLATLPNDPMLDLLWGVRNTGQTGGTTNADIRATEAWDTWTGSSNVLVAIIDTGVDYAHSDLAGNIWINPQETGSLATNGIDDDGNGLTDDFRGWDFYNGDNNPIDDNDHGTHCAGVIGAVGDNAEGVAGVCWDVSLVGLKVFSSDGSPDWSYYHGYAYLSDTIDATYYATDLGARVINNSWGLSTSDIHGGDLALLTEAIEYANSNGVLYVAAAGNNARDNDSDYWREYPASLSCSNIIAVAASTDDDGLASFSSYGHTKVDLAAPGEAICSTIRDNRYGTMDGTSMSAPYVAGAAALLWSCNPALTAPQVKAALLDNVDTNAAFAGKMVSGGRLNVARSLSSVSRLHFDSPRYFGNSWATLTMADMALTNSLPQAIAITSGIGDAESLLLHETAVASGVFTNRLYIQLNGTANPGNGLIEATDGTQIIATYTNATLLITNMTTAVVNHGLSITISTPSQYVPLSTESFQVEGINNGNVLVSMVVSNEATGSSHGFTGTNGWTAPSVSVTNGVNTIWVSGTNAYGSADSAFVTITRVGPVGVTNFVSLSGTHVWPYTSWETASTSIHAAVEAAFEGNSVVITNGTYPLSSEVSVNRGITIRGVGDRDVVLVDGQDSTRCFFVNHANASVESITMQGGNATDGAGAYCAAGIISNCVVRDSSATLGGGVYCTLSGHVDSSLLSDNSATYGGGGYCAIGGTLANCDIVDNDASGGGGGIFMGLGAAIWDSLVVSNDAVQGGGLWLQNAAVADACRIVNNTAIRGAGAHVSGGGLSGCNVASNSTRYNWRYTIDGGGGIYLEDGGSIEACKVIGNHAETKGGGILFDGSSETVLVRNCLIAGNVAGSDMILREFGGGASTGGGIWGKWACDVENCTIAANSAWDSAGGVDITGSQCSFSNTIVYHNVSLEYGNYRGGAYSHCNTMPLPPGLGNVTNDPLFVSQNFGDYRLSPESHCIDAGQNAGWMFASQDLAGKDRISDSVVDIGAYELGVDLEVGLADKQNGVAPLVAELRAVVLGEPAATLSFHWDVDGDGSIDASGIGLSVVTNVYSLPGVYAVGVSVSNSSGEVASDLEDQCVFVGPQSAYVSPSGQHTWPFTNWATAATNIQAAIDVAGAGTHVNVTQGVYRISEELRMGKGVHLFGHSTTGSVVVDAQEMDRCMHIFHPDAVVSNMTFTRGKLTDGTCGAGVFMDGGGALINCTIISNKADRLSSWADGLFGAGGVLVYRSGLVSHCLMKGNQSDDLGGAAILYGGGLIEDSTISSNTAYEHGSGTHRYHALAVLHDGEIRRCNIQANHCGGVDLRYGGRLVDSVITGNEKSPAVMVMDGALVRGCLVADNVGTGVEFEYYPDIVGSVVESCTLAGNSIGVVGDSHPSVDSRVLNTVAAGNSSVNANVHPTYMDVSHCFFDDNAEFADPAAGDYRLMPGSPCSNAGSNQTWMAASQDLDGNPRVAFDIVDIGAYELSSAFACGFQALPCIGMSPLDSVFTAHVSGYNTNGLYYWWDFENDGATDAEGFGLSVVSNQYVQPGVYTVHLTVSNSVQELAERLRSDYVVVEGLDHLAFSQIDSPQTGSVPFRVTITAQDTNDSTVTTFTNVVDLVATNGSPVSMSPGTTDAFTEGQWSGWVTIDYPTDDVRLIADDGEGTTGTSSVFDVTYGALHDFEWSPISSLQFTNAPIPVTLRARDENGHTVSGFTNIVSLSGLRISMPTKTVYGGIAHDASSITTYTRGIVFTPSTNITLTHVRHYWGSKVSLWTDSGTLLFAVDVSSTPETWKETELASPVTLASSNTYRIAAYGNSEEFFYRTGGLPFAFEHGTVHASCHWSGDHFPDTITTANRYFVDFTYGAGGLAEIETAPSNTTPFAGGVWTGDVQVRENAAQVFLRAEGGGHSGDSAWFSVGMASLEIASEHGGAIPPEGVHYYPHAEQIVPVVTTSPLDSGTTQYVCVGWTGTGAVLSDPYGGTNAGPISLTNHSSLAWLWETNYLLSIDAGAGTVDMVDGWYIAGTTVVTTLSVPEGHLFNGWTGDTGGCSWVDTELTIPMTSPRSLTAVYTREYFVNDNSTNRDAWCIAPGDDGNDGTAPHSPKRTVQSLLASLEPGGLEPGDVVRIDTGLYTNDSNIQVGSIHDGSSSAPVTFEASPYGVTIDRNNTASGNYGWQIMSGADYITIRTAVDTNYPSRNQSWMKVTGGYCGFYVDGRHCRLSRIDICDNLLRGVHVDEDYAEIENCLVRGSSHVSSGAGIYFDHYDEYYSIRNCTIEGNARYGIYIGWANGSILNSIVCAEGAGNYAVYRSLASFSLDSDYNDLVALNGATVGYSGTAQPTLADWQAATGEDANSISADPRFAGVAAGDYHLRSMEGRYGSDGTWTTDLEISPAVDVGDPASVWTNEPAPNGARMNLGAYGNTEQASKSATNTLCPLLVDSTHGAPLPETGQHLYYEGAELSCAMLGSPEETGSTQYMCQGWIGTGSVASVPDGGTNTGVFALGTNSTLTWLWETNYLLSIDAGTGTVDVADGWYIAGTTLVTTLTVPEGHVFTGWTGDTGGCSWVDTELTISMTTPRGLTAVYTREYFVNDGSTNLDAWCTAPGDDGNDGFSPARPKVTVQAILDTYDLEPGDVVRIDTGGYTLDNNITVESGDAGISGQPMVIEASPYGVTIDRNNTASGSYGWQILSGADYVTLRTAISTNHPDRAQRLMKVTGGYFGLYVDGRYCQIIKVDACSNLYRGIYVDDEHALIENCLARGNSSTSSGTGIYIGSGGDYAEIRNCTVAGNAKYGVYFYYSRGALQNNIIHADGVGDYAVYRNSTSYQLTSDYNDLFADNGAYVGYSGANRFVLADWQAATGQDAHSIGVEPNFVDPVAGDYHFKSTAGSYHEGAWTTDTVSSAAIDAGYGDEGTEPAPNKTAWAGVGLGRRNLGAYGGTAQGSKTPNQRRLELLEPVGGEVYTSQTNPVEISWQRFGAGWGSGDTLLLEYSADSSSTWTGIPGAGSEIATNGVYLWDVSSLTPGPLYRVRITCNQETGVTDESAGDFRIGEFLVFFVNDASTTNDNWCSGLGSDTNNGLAPATPKADVQAILDTYDLEPGDTVRIDTGTYTPTNNIAVGTGDEGSSANPVVFEASPYGVTIDRGDISSGQYGWHIMSGADYVTIRTAVDTNYPSRAQSWMKVTGGYFGLFVDGRYCRISRIDMCDNLYRAMYVDDDHALIESCLARGSSNSTSGAGIYVGNGGDYVVISNCTVYGNAKYGVYFDYSRGSLQNNIIHADGTGDYAVYRNSTDLLTSDFNDLFGENGAYVGFSGANQATLLEWRNATGGDANSISVDPAFVDASGGDYHLMSTTGSYHQGTWAADPASSLAIDAGYGDEGDEPVPNKTAWAAPNVGRRNLGAYGGTEQGSKTPDERVSLRLTEPVGGETYVSQTNPVAVSWTWIGGGWLSNDTAMIEYSTNSGTAWSGIPGADSVAVTNSVYSWDISGLTPGHLYRVRITCNQDSALTDQSAEDFRIGKFLTFYVNDGSTNLDNWCMQPGDDQNDGVAPDSPKATIQSVLDAYDLEPGDVVRIDTGLYTNDSNIEVTSDDEGSSADPVVFEASPYGVRIDRNNTGSGNYGWHLNHCDYVTISTATSTNYPAATQGWMRIGGGYYGLYVYYANYCTLDRVEIASNANDGIYGYYGHHAVYSNCLIRANGDDGAELDYCDYNTLHNCTFAGNSDDQLYADYSTSPLIVRNSILVADGVGDYAAYLYSSSYAVDWDYNCLVATNGAHVGYASGARTTLADWQAATGEDANSISVDPAFADPVDGNYHPMSVEGRYVEGDVWASDTHHSLCIDAGDPVGTWTNEPAANGSRLNMGAYGNTEQASKSLTNTVWTVRVASDHGLATPPVDVHTYYENSLVDCSVTPEQVDGSTKYVCTGWSLAGQADTNGQFAGSSPEMALVLTNHSALTWLWSTNDWVHRYVWDSIGATQYVHTPFAVGLNAEDVHGAVVTGYAGSASISAWFDAETTNTVYGSANHNSSSSSTGTRGIRVTPSSDLTVTHVRHYWGGKVSIWKDDGTLLASKTVTSTPETWLETPLDEPITLLAGQTYRIGAYYVSGSSTFYYHYNNCPFSFPNGTVLSSCYGSGDAFPATLITYDSYFVDVGYTAGPFDSAAVSPTNTGAFVSGIWTGEVAVLNAGTNAYLRAQDTNDRKGNSAAFDLHANTPMGTPISWLRLHGLTNGPCYTVELQNPDGDEMFTWEEYVADTIPTDGDSFLAITGLISTVDGIQVMWKGGTNAWQALESRQDLMATGEQWIAVFTNPPPTSGTTNYLHEGATNRVLYYRLKAWR